MSRGNVGALKPTTHAVHDADRLLTRDLGFYRVHFADLTLLQ